MQTFEGIHDAIRERAGGEAAEADIVGYIVGFHVHGVSFPAKLLSPEEGGGVEIRQSKGLFATAIGGIFRERKKTLHETNCYPCP
jgi:hypothetical protein